jgi:hypothetical protein
MGGGDNGDCCSYSCGHSSKLAEGMHEVFIAIVRHLNNATAPIEIIDGQLLTLEQQTKRRGPEGFARYVLATFICIAAILAWHSYSEAAKQRLASAVQPAPQNLTPKAPVAPSIDPGQVHQIASGVAAQRNTSTNANFYAAEAATPITPIRTPTPASACRFIV